MTKRADLVFLRDLMVEGKLAPVLEKTYPMVKRRKQFPGSSKATPASSSSSQLRKTARRNEPNQS
ncbi:MAG: hypothetical protein ABI946_05000 [Chthoniobacterales bacterium]